MAPSRKRTKIVRNRATASRKTVSSQKTKDNISQKKKDTIAIEKKHPMKKVTFP